MAPTSNISGLNLWPFIGRPLPCFTLALTTAKAAVLISIQNVTKKRCDSVWSKFPEMLGNFLKECAFLFFCVG